MYNAIEVACYIINYCNDNRIEISNLKLQKILYYVQAASLVEIGDKCFSDPIIAWQYGPVITSVYYRYNLYGGDPIPKQETFKKISFDKDKMTIKLTDSEGITPNFKFIIYKVIEAYKNVHNPFYLVRKTHSEQPWADTSINKEIDVEKIRTYYSKNPDKIYK